MVADYVTRSGAEGPSHISRYPSLRGKQKPKNPEKPKKSLREENKSQKADGDRSPREKPRKARNPIPKHHRPREVLLTGARADTQFGSLPATRAANQLFTAPRVSISTPPPVRPRSCKAQCGDSEVLSPLDLPWRRTRPSWSRCGVRAAFDTVLSTATAFSLDVLTLPTRRPRSDPTAGLRWLVRRRSFLRRFRHVM